MKLDILMHYEVNEITGEIKFIGKEEVSVDSGKKATKASSTLGGGKPLLKLNANNFALNKEACELLKVDVGNTIHINYTKRNDKYIPTIGASEAFNVKAGNKITKSLTVSYRGSANSRLAEFGEFFEFEPTDNPGLFYLKGDKEVETIKQNAIEIDDSFELEDLEDLDLDTDESLDISTIDLTL